MQLRLFSLSACSPPNPFPLAFKRVLMSRSSTLMVPSADSETPCRNRDVNVTLPPHPPPFISSYTVSVGAAFIPLQTVTSGLEVLQHTATHRHSLQHTAIHCNMTRSDLRMAAVYKQTRPLKTSNTLQHAATRCKTLQHAAKRYNTLQHTAIHIATRCNTLQDTATHISTRLEALEIPALESPLQHTAT